MNYFLLQLRFGVLASAGGGEDVWAAVINFIFPWFWRIGFLIAIIGVVTFVMGLHQEDPGQKNKGVLAFVSGAILAGVGIWALSVLI